MFFMQYLRNGGYPEVVASRQSIYYFKSLYSFWGFWFSRSHHIFLSEFQQYLGKEHSSYLIPDDIESRLKSGSRKRNDEQLHHFNEVKSDNSELQQLIDLIHNERKAYDQEGYIKLGKE